MAQDVRIDGFDRKLLAALQADGRLTNQQLADVVGLSASQCSRRRAALEEAGVIGGYRAVLDAAALGFGLLVFIQVTLNTHSRDNARHFRQLVAGLVNDVLLPHESVAHVRSSIVFDCLKDSELIPVSAVQ